MHDRRSRFAVQQVSPRTNFYRVNLPETIGLRVRVTVSLSEAGTAEMRDYLQLVVSWPSHFVTIVFVERKRRRLFISQGWSAYFREAVLLS